MKEKQRYIRLSIS